MDRNESLTLEIARLLDREARAQDALQEMRLELQRQTDERQADRLTPSQPQPAPLPIVTPAAKVEMEPPGEARDLPAPVGAQTASAAGDDYFASLMEFHSRTQTAGRRQMMAASISIAISVLIVCAAVYAFTLNR